MEMKELGRSISHGMIREWYSQHILDPFPSSMSQTSCWRKKPSGWRSINTRAHTHTHTHTHTHQHTNTQTYKHKHTHSSNWQSSTHKCIKSRCVSFFPLQWCGNNCGVIVSILAVFISTDANLFFSFCKSKSIYPAFSNHTYRMYQDITVFYV